MRLGRRHHFGRYGAGQHDPFAVRHPWARSFRDDFSVPAEVVDGIASFKLKERASAGVEDSLWKSVQVVLASASRLYQ